MLVICRGDVVFLSKSVGYLSRIVGLLSKIVGVLTKVSLQSFGFDIVTQPSYYILYLYKSINKKSNRKSSLSQLRKRRGSIWEERSLKVIRWLKFFLWGKERFRPRVRVQACVCAYRCRCA